MAPKHCRFERHPALPIISRNCTHSTCISHRLTSASTSCCATGSASIHFHFPQSPVPIGNSHQGFPRNTCMFGQHTLQRVNLIPRPVPDALCFTTSTGQSAQLKNTSPCTRVTLGNTKKISILASNAGVRTTRKERRPERAHTSVIRHPSPRHQPSGRWQVRRHQWELRGCCKEATVSSQPWDWRGTKAV